MKHPANHRDAFAALDTELAVIPRVASDHMLRHGVDHLRSHAWRVLHFIAAHAAPDSVGMRRLADGLALEARQYRGVKARDRNGNADQRRRWFYRVQVLHMARSAYHLASPQRAMKSGSLPAPLDVLRMERRSEVPSSPGDALDWLKQRYPKLLAPAHMESVRYEAMCYIDAYAEEPPAGVCLRKVIAAISQQTTDKINALLGPSMFRAPLDPHNPFARPLSSEPVLPS